MIRHCAHLRNGKKVVTVCDFLLTSSRCEHIVFFNGSDCHNTNTGKIAMKYDWTTTDWQQPTTLIAKALGCRKETVSRARRKHAPYTVGCIKMPPSSYSTGRPQVIHPNNAITVLRQLTGWTNQQVADALGCSIGKAYIYGSNKRSMPRDMVVGVNYLIEKHTREQQQ